MSSSERSSPSRRRLYVVNVKGGGTFLYDAIDVGRLVLKMAEQGDHRAFTVKPEPWHWRVVDRVRDWWVAR